MNQTPHNTAIYYHPEAYSINAPKLMGRNAAGESFLRGFLKHFKKDTLWAQVTQTEHLKSFETVARANGRVEDIKGFDAKSSELLSHVGLLYYPGPDIAEQKKGCQALFSKCPNGCQALF